MEQNSQNSWSFPLVVCGSIGLLEWWVVALTSSPGSEEAARTLLAVVALYGLMAFAATVVARIAAPAPAAVAPAGLVFLAVAIRVGFGWGALLASAATGWAAYLLIAGLLRRWRFGAGSLWAFYLFGFALTVGVLAVAASGRAGWVGSAAVLVATALAVSAARLSRSSGGRRSSLLAAGHLVLLAAVGWIALSPTPLLISGPAPASSPSVLLVTIDTLRADRLGCYGYDGARTPNLDALAARGVLFGDAVTHSPWTGPSHMTILTGLLPQTHRAAFNRTPLPAEIETIADDFRHAGFVAGGFVSGWPLKDDGTHIGSRFHDFDDDLREVRWFPRNSYRITLLGYVKTWLQSRGTKFKEVERDAREVTDAVTDWLERRGGRPFFLWVHYYDPHLPFTAPDDYVIAGGEYDGPASGAWYDVPPGIQAEIVASDEAMQRMADLYDAEIAYTDHELGRLLEAAERAAPDAGLWIAATADHGESHDEHGIYFARDLYEPTMRVPLIIAPPAGHEIGPRLVDGQVGLIDVAPTLLALSGIEPGRRLDGRSLVNRMRGRSGENPAPAILTLHADGQQRIRQSYAVRHDGWKLIQRLPGWRGHWWTEASAELYDLTGDPQESTDRLDDAPEVRERLSEILLPYLTAADGDDNELTPEEIEMLRSLGYIR